MTAASTSDARKRNAAQVDPVDESPTAVAIRAIKAEAWYEAVNEARGMGKVENESWFFDALAARNPYVTRRSL